MVDGLNTYSYSSFSHLLCYFLSYFVRSLEKMIHLVKDEGSGSHESEGMTDLNKGYDFGDNETVGMEIRKEE